MRPFFILGVVFLLANAGLWLYYSQRSYPETEVMGIAVGNQEHRRLEAQVRLPEKLRLTHLDRSVDAAPGDLGISLDLGRLRGELESSRTWFPVAGIFVAHRLAAPVRVDAEQLAPLAPAFQKDPVPARTEREGAAFVLTRPEDGYELDLGRLPSAIEEALTAGNDTVEMPVTVLPAPPAPPELERATEALQRQLGVPLSYRYQGAAVSPSPFERSEWYVRSGDAYALSDARVRSYLTLVAEGLGTRARNLAQLVSATRQALTAEAPLDAELLPFSRWHTYTYCVAARNIESGGLPELSAAARTAFDDPRGWSLDGQVAFRQVESNCDFTLWLSAPNDVPSFSPLCDVEWSCRVGNDVIINFDRWQNASPSWNRSGGTLADYRTMVINHETGHWLGFGHLECPAPGAAAPVMQQQSIDLQGCAFNPWSTPAEQAALRVHLGL